MSTMRNERKSGKQRQRGEHKALFALGSMLGKSSSIEEGIDLILHAVKLGFRTEQCVIMLFDAADRLEVKGFIGMEKDRAHAVKEWFQYSGLKDGVRKEGTCFVKCAEAGIGDFLVAPLEVARKNIGFITVHRVRGRSLQGPEMKQLFSVLADMVVPHILNAQFKEKNHMRGNGIFHSLVDALDSSIDRVREYNGALSVAIVRVENYAQLCADLGVFEAAEHVRGLGERLASSVQVVNETARINDDSFAVILPLISAEETSDMMKEIASSLPVELVLSDTIVSYPRDGETGALLLREGYRHRRDDKRSLFQHTQNTARDIGAMSL